MSKKKLIVSILITIILIISLFEIKRFIQIDKCLDKGGRWNYEMNKCENVYDLNSSIITDFYWHSAWDTIRNKEIVIKGKLTDSINQSPDLLIQILNRRKSKCKIDFIDILKDTIKIRITEDEVLTEQMGTAGAHIFLGETVYTLTEYDPIKYVRIEMEYGSHASPGIYKREDFEDLIIK